jgi:metallophosphoesterase superfamily enzyme
MNMPASIVALSDLHLGYSSSILDDPAVQDRVVGEIADLCGGATDRLVLNGDCFESCVPLDAGRHDAHGFPPSMAAASRSFLQKFTDRIVTGSLVILWGNHDYCLWNRLAASCGVPTFTNNLRGDVLLQHDGCVLPGAESFVEDVIGPAAAKLFRIRSAYPNYILGHNWPYVVFHHGHLLDGLVLGRLPDLDYLALRVLVGAGRPKVDDDMDMLAVHGATRDFISAMWKYNSPIRAAEWLVLRRTESAHHCPYHPGTDPLSAIVGAEIQGAQLGDRLKWYVDALMADPTTPGAIGTSRAPCHLFIGHDHDGGAGDVTGLDGRSWRIVNLGGWTADRGESDLHTHVMIWDTGADVPRIHCL